MNESQTTSSVSKIVKMTEKKCTKCLEVKSINEFYLSTFVRSECKNCTRTHVKKNQKPYKERYPTKESKAGLNAYQKDYYSKNKEKMREYRETFNKKNPGYHKEYLGKRNQLKAESEKVKELA